MSFKATVAGTAHEPLLNCPNCNYEIRLTESLAAPLLAETRQRFQEQLASKDAEVARKRSMTKSSNAWPRRGASWLPLRPKRRAKLPQPN